MTDSAERLSIDALVTHHTDGFRSGVARFNELLAGHLGVPLKSLTDPAILELRRPLLSFKVTELGCEVAPVVAALTAPGRMWEIFLHEYHGGELERHLVAGAARVNCGNREIYERVRKLNEAANPVWTPGLLNDERTLPDPELSVFSFGMAHKIRADMFRRLRGLLDSSGKSYAIFVSAANHETVSMRDAEDVFTEMHAIFPDELFFLGNLSDVAIAHWLKRATYFAAFFTPAVRANNTSVASAMERGVVVITNVDEFSPAECIHEKTVLDLLRCDELPTDPDFLAALGRRAGEAVRGRNWAALVSRIEAGTGASPGTEPG
jgi:hypothetical protein